MTNQPRTGPVTIVDCPLCDAPAAADLDEGALDCPACGRFELVADDRQPLAAAA